jgi:hypothetical protein
VSVVTEILDRLSGIAVVRERLAETGKRVDSLAEHLLDHERRLTRLEVLIAEPVKGGRGGSRK